MPLCQRFARSVVALASVAGVLPALAHSGGAPVSSLGAAAHAPIGVMGDHIHKAGE